MTQQERNGNVYHDDPHGANLSRAVVTPGGLVITSGHVPDLPDGTMVNSPDIRDAMRQAFTNLGATLEECGATFDDVIKLTIFLAQPADWHALREVRREFINPPYPASTGVVAATLDPAMRFEVEAIAQITPAG